MKSSNLRNIAKGVLELEILALKKLKKSINKTFEEFQEFLRERRGETF